MTVDEPYHTLQWVREKAPVPQSPLGGPLQVPDALAEQLTLQPTYGNNCPLLRVVPSSGKARPKCDSGNALDVHHQVAHWPL